MVDWCRIEVEKQVKKTWRMTRRGRVNQNKGDGAENKKKILLKNRNKERNT